MAVAEACGRRDGAPDRLDELAGALEPPLAPAPADGAGDLAGVALLAVLAQDRGQLALARLVDELGGGAVGLRVHAHVQRRVHCVREAALRLVDLHAGDAEVEENGVGANPVRGELLEHDGEVTAQEARLHRGALPELVEVDARERVAVDRDQLALAAQVGREQGRMAARSEGRVDDGLARPHREGLADLLCENGNVVSRAGSQDVRQHPPHSLPSP